jgi:hypothetical protein
MSPNIPSGNRELTILDVSKDNLGWCDVLPKGWSLHPGNGAHARYKHTDGTFAAEGSPPAGGISSGLIALATSIRDMGAMTSLSLSLASNSLGVEGAKIIAEFLPKCT